MRLANASYPVIIGSRDAEKAKRTANKISEIVQGANVIGLENSVAAKKGDIIFLSIPFAHQAMTLHSIRNELAGKILVDTTVPLKPPNVKVVQLPREGSSAIIAKQIIGDTAKVVSAFQNISATLLQDLHHKITCDVLVFGDDKEAREEVIQLIESMGLAGWHCGSLANSAAAEALTSVLIFINSNYKLSHTGIKISGN